MADAKLVFDKCKRGDIDGALSELRGLSDDPYVTYFDWLVESDNQEHFVGFGEEGEFDNAQMTNAVKLIEGMIDNPKGDMETVAMASLQVGLVLTGRMDELVDDEDLDDEDIEIKTMTQTMKPDMALASKLINFSKQNLDKDEVDWEILAGVMGE